MGQARFTTADVQAYQKEIATVMARPMPMAMVCAIPKTIVSGRSMPPEFVMAIANSMPMATGSAMTMATTPVTERWTPVASVTVQVLSTNADVPIWPREHAIALVTLPI
jgi:hypothetical protein